VVQGGVFGEAGPQVGVHAQFHPDVQAAHLLPVVCCDRK
jgi:hypothetical protein